MLIDNLESDSSKVINHAGATAAREGILCSEELVNPTSLENTRKCHSPDMVYAILQAVLESRATPYPRDNLPGPLGAGLMM
jgi:acyl CoA:acetate/3-ketoacid CoA transferase alpha subunit